MEIKSSVALQPRLLIVVDRMAFPSWHWRQGWSLVRFIFIFYFVIRLPLCNKYSDVIVTFISILCYYICCLLGACMRCTRFCSLKPGCDIITQFILMFGVMLILSIPYLFVLLRIAVRSRESEDHPSTWNLESQASCALDHFFYPVMFWLIIMICIG
jgi:hypothetical protein